MAPSVATPQVLDTQYPDSDGKPMSDNTKQAEWITLIFDNLRALFANDANVFVAADNMVYPVQVERGQKPPCQAPDVYVVFGRPKGYRGSYKYWEEDNVPVTVAFEILSPSNTPFEMADKRDFYEEHEIEEYYAYDPDTNQLQIYQRVNTALRRVRPPHDFVSPRMGIRFDLSGEELVIRYPDGRPFVEFAEERQRADEAEELAAQERARAEQERARAEQEQARTEREQARAEREQARAEQERARAEAAEQAARLESERVEQTQQRMARVLELSRKVRRGQATPEELVELEQLEVAGE